MSEKSFNESITVILFQPEKPGNLGSIARSIKNFGFHNLIIINPRTTLTEEAYNYSVHAKDILNSAEIMQIPDDKHKKQAVKKIFSEFDIVIGTSCRIFKEKTLHRIPIPIQSFVEELQNIKDLNQKRIGIVFGTEASGLENWVLFLVDYLVTIPTSSNYRSINLAHSVTIFLYELSSIFTDVDIKGDIDIAPRPKRAILFEFFDEMIELTNTPKHKIARSSRAFKSIMSRAHLSKRELTLMLGIFRKIVNLAKEGKPELFS